MKQLRSGILVKIQQYHLLLEWKDLYPDKFEFFTRSCRAPYASINDMYTDDYNKLLIFAGLAEPVNVPS